MSTSLDTCEDGHEPVAYNGYDTTCPVCIMEDELTEKYNELEEERDDLKQQVSDLTDEVEELNAKLEALSSIEESIKEAVRERL